MSAVVQDVGNLPAPDLSMLVARTWREAGVEPLPGLGFVEAGGDSLLLLNLLFRLETALDRAIPMDRLDGAMDVAAMAGALDINAGQVQPEAPPEAPHIFLLPGIGGDEPRVAALRATLRPAIRMEVLAYLDWRSQLQVPPPDMAALVSHLVDQIEQSAPAGAVRLAGYSYGCRMAHAVASALIQRGRTVAGPVLLLDGPARVSGRSSRPEYHARDIPNFGRLERLALWTVRQLIRPGSHLALKLVAMAPRRWWGGLFGFYLRKYLTCVLLGPAAAPYRPHRIGVDALLIRSAEHGPDAAGDAAERAGPDGLMGWAHCWAQLRVVDVPGNHLSMLAGEGLQAIHTEVLKALQL
jgi:thioesterase domain-containing protein